MIECSAEIVVLGLEPLDPFAGIDACVQLSFFAELKEIFCVTALQYLGLAGVLEPLNRVLADRLQHPEAVGLAHANQALVNERFERVEICGADRFSRLERRSAREDGEPSEEPLLVLG